MNKKRSGRDMTRLVARRYPTIEYDDLLQETLWHMWEGRRLDNPAKGSLRTFLYVIADNIAKDILKSVADKSRRAEAILKKALKSGPAQRRRGDQPGSPEAGTGCTDDEPAELLEPAQALSILEIDLIDILWKLPDPKRRIILAWADRDGDAWTAD